MIFIKQRQGKLIVQYEPDNRGNPNWILERFKQGVRVSISRTFTYGKSDLIKTSGDDDDRTYEFLLGIKKNGYYRISSAIRGTRDDVLIHEAMDIRSDFFTATLKIPILPKISHLVGGRELVIGGNKPEAIPGDDFEALVRSFPNSTEQRKYVVATIGRLLKEYFDIKPDPERTFDDYVERRRGQRAPLTKPEIAEIEAQKYTYIRDEIARLLGSSESYSERQWQRLILQFILILFPKYLYAPEEVLVRDAYLGTRRKIDMMLIDAGGFVDVIEIKKPFDEFRLTAAGSATRGNYTPRRGLSDTIFQAEKYIYHLNKWGAAGEEAITKALRKKRLFGDDFEVRIANPKAMIIAGRTNTMSPQQRFDFEIIRRHYANVMEIMTYDDLLERLGRIIAKFRRQL